jgi:uncharacterized NAD(P)/FAD-binding protein YdhS
MFLNGYPKKLEIVKQVRLVADLLVQQGMQRRSNTTALVRNTAEIFRNLELSQQLPFVPKSDACWYD